MRGKKLLVMAIVLVALVAIVAVQNRNAHNRRRPAERSGPALLEGVDLNALTGVEIAQGTNRVVLTKKDGTWKVASLYDYPVDFDRLADALRAMADVKLGAPLRTRNISAKEFGLEGDDVLRITLKDGDKTVASVEVGARRKPSSGSWAEERFLRKKGSDAVYLVSYDFQPFTPIAEDWIKKSILDVSAEDVVSVERGDVKLRMEGGKWTLVDLDPKKEKLKTAEAGRLRRALQFLTCTSVADPSLSDAELGFTNAVPFVARTRDGFIYTVKIGARHEGNNYARFSVAYQKPEPPAPTAESAKKEEKEKYEKEKKAFEERCEADRRKAEELDKRLRPWTYLIPAFAADNFLLTRDKLVEEVKEAEKKETSGTTNQGDETSTNGVAAVVSLPVSAASATNAPAQETDGGSDGKAAKKTDSKTEKSAQQGD